MSRNKTLVATKQLIEKHKNLLNDKVKINHISNIDIMDGIKQLKDKSIDLLVTDPPYNLEKQYGNNKFKKMTWQEYTLWFEQWVVSIIPKLKPNASIYICSDWNTTNIIFPIINKYFNIRNRITWQRDKGRSSTTNWKNNIEDIFYATIDKKNFTFNSDKVLQRKKIIAPYRNPDGTPKGWIEDSTGRYRLTGASNVMVDITIPYWSMHENTEHPTQKPEKLLAKLILASSNEGDLICDPFMGSGTTAVVSKKLNRNFVGFEKEKKYVSLALERLQRANEDKAIQGYNGRYFYDRNEK